MKNARKRILLLNPPGDQLYLRDYYCSHVSKGSYYWHPYDLIVQSGILGREHEVRAVDANVLQLTPERARVEVLREPFDVLYFLTGAACWDQDFAFIQSLNLPAETRIATTGDICRSRPVEMLEDTPWLDAILLDLTSYSLLNYVNAGEPPETALPNLAHRTRNDDILNGGEVREGNPFKLPLPRYDLFPYHRYRIPHGRKSPFHSLLTDHGCAYKCTFCIGGDLSFRWRDVDNTIAELKYVKSLGIDDLWFKDLTFGAHRKHAMELCQAMIDEKLDMHWVCLSRVNVMDEEMLEIFARAGCHTIQFGVESASDEILKRIRKQIRKDRVFEMFRLCREKGIRTLGHFMLGVPGETEDSARETIEYAKALDPDIASFNIATPRMGTRFRRETIEDGHTSERVDVLDNSKAFPTIETEYLSRETLWKLRNQAIREFYSRPRYLWRRLTKARSGGEFLGSVKDGLSLFSSLRGPARRVELHDSE